MNKKGRIIILLLILVVIVVAVKTFISLNTIYFGSNTKAIVVGNKIIKRNNYRKVLLKRVNYYKGGKKFKGYLKSTKDDIGYSYYVVSSNNKKNVIKDLVAAGSMVKLDFVSSSNYETSIDETNLKKINDVLDLSLETKNVVEYKNISFDIDNDETKENVIYIRYLVGNIRTTKIFVIDNDDAIDLVELEFDYSDIANSSNKVYYISDVVDINNDGKYEIIIGRIDGDSQPTYYDIYSYENGSIKEIK